MPTNNESSAAQGHAETIRTALQGAMVGAWGRENALRALAELEAENLKLRELESVVRAAQFPHDRRFLEIHRLLGELDE